MKTTVRIQLMMMILVAATLLTYGQGYDEARMERDLKVAENILGTLNSGSNRFYFNNSIESNYIPDYGVIFSVPQSSRISGRVARASTIRATSGGTYVISEDEADAPDAVELKAVGEAKAAEDGVSQEITDGLKEQITTFLVDYADLIGQLKPTDRIVVQTRGRNDLVWISAGQGHRSSKDNAGMSGQILKSDLIAYKQGKMDREAAMKKITWTTDEDTEVSKDIELFSSIFARLYEPDLSNTYYTSSRRIGYTQLENFGITFRMKVYSSTSDEGLHTISTTGEGGLTQEQRNEKVNAMYPEFERSFKENLLDYGRTIKSLKSDEMLVFKVELTECKGCEMPEEIEVSVKGKVLNDFDSGSLTRSKALEQITVKKKRR